MGFKRVPKKEVSDDLLFTAYGVLGFGILDISSQVEESQDNVLIIDFLLPKFVKVFIGALNIEQCDRKSIKKLIFYLKNWELKNPKLQGFENAEISGGNKC